MHIYIMTDLEGVCGVMNSEDWCTTTSRYYEQGRELLTREVNAAVEGFLEAGATEITVADGHGEGAVNGMLLHPKASLMRGWPGKAYPFGLNWGRFDFLAHVGQHAKSGSVYAHLAHTGNFGCRDISINGVSVGEFGETSLCATELGIRSIFATGDEAFAKEAQALVPGIETVVVKRGSNPDPGHELPADAYARHNTAAVHLQPEEARRRIRAGATRALTRARAERFGLIDIHPPYEFVWVLRNTAAHPPRVARARHPASVIELLNGPKEFKPICAADPMNLIQRP